MRTQETAFARTTRFPGAKGYEYKLLKETKSATVYELANPDFTPTFLTPLVRIEDFRGYSKGRNFQLYFRIKNRSSWAKSLAVTGLFKTNLRGVYKGDMRQGDTRTLILFKLWKNEDRMTVYTFPSGFMPSPARVEFIASKI